MHYAIDRFQQEVTAALLSTGLVTQSEIATEQPAAKVSADLTFPVFRSAKDRDVPPQHFAQELVTALPVAPGSLIGSVSAAGPFVNFVIDPVRYAAAVLGEIAALGDGYGHDTSEARQPIVIDYSAPNIAKRMHVGHIRSTIIGQALANILSALGYRVIRDNHLGDWGKSFGVLLAAITHEGMPSGEGEQLLANLETLYAKHSSLASQDPRIDQEARDWSLRLEQGNLSARAHWQRMVDLTVQVNQVNYDRLGVQFDHHYGESFYEPMFADVIATAEERGVAHRDVSGALVVDTDDQLPTFLLQRSDGASLYHTRDVATIQFRVQTFCPMQIIYVVGAPQKLYLKQLFALARALGIAEGVDLVHVPFGTVFDAHGQALSTRRGNMVYLETLLNEAHLRARHIVDATRPDLPEEERDSIAEAVGVGAVIYNDLHQDPKRNITLDWDRMLAFDGNSAPYIQYMHARCRSILQRAGARSGDPAASTATIQDLALLTHPSEIEVIKQLAQFPRAVREAGRRHAPFLVASWCYETARRVAAFYRDCLVLQDENLELRAARVELVAAAAHVMKNGLGLLGIAAPERL